VYVDISFVDPEVEAICRQPKKAVAHIGALSAKKLSLRLSELFASDNVSELVAGRPHVLSGNRKGQMALDLHGGLRVVFKPTKLPPPQRKDGAIDWGRVTAVTIIFIGDYHD
jgi:toxin HigB-1